MNYTAKANSAAKKSGLIAIKQTDIAFGITNESPQTLPNPAELLLGSLCACILKNVERFSNFMHFNYSDAEVMINATRANKPPKMEVIHYELTIHSETDINISLLKKNLEKFGTIYNTLKSTCAIEGEIKVLSEKK